MMESEKSPEEQENEVLGKKDKDNLLYWSLFFIAAVVILFFAGGRFFSDSAPEYETVEYNNWIFTRMAGMWWFEWQNGENLYQVPLRFNPYEVEDIPIKGRIDADKFNAVKGVYISFDLSNETSQNMPMLALAATELTQNIATAINRVPVAACANNMSDACIGRPVKTCENTDEPVIFLSEGGDAELALEGACITIRGEGADLVMAVDRLLYHWYRIIPND